jgi:SPX domain protein involved in polyphosphate accumulation
MTMFISFTNGWKMTLVVLAGLPIIAYANSVQNADPEDSVEEESDGVSYNIESQKSFPI